MRTVGDSARATAAAIRPRQIVSVLFRQLRPFMSRVGEKWSAQLPVDGNCAVVKTG
jgi:hypothetical protein